MAPRGQGEGVPVSRIAARREVRASGGPGAVQACFLPSPHVHPEYEARMATNRQGDHEASVDRSGRDARARSRRIARAPDQRIERATSAKSVAALVAIGSLVAGAAVYGARYSPEKRGTRSWYRRLEKPPFNPPSSVFPPVWTALYTLIALSAWRVWRRPPGRKRSAALALWGGQLIANAAWTKLFFGERRPKAALADIVALLTTISIYTAVARDVDGPAAAMMFPYGAWVAFATTLNEEVVRRNP